MRASFRDDRPLRWVRVHDLPDFVYFNHSIHVKKGVGCETCHGRIDQMPLTLPAELAADGVVHRLSSEPGAESPPAQRDHDHGLPAGRWTSR